MGLVCGRQRPGPPHTSWVERGSQVPHGSHFVCYPKKCLPSIQYEISQKQVAQKLQVYNYYRNANEHQRKLRKEI